MYRSVLLVAVAVLVLVLAACSTSGPSPALADAVGDLVAPGGEPLEGPDYIDIRSLVAVAKGSTLRLTLTFAGALPAAPPPTIENLRYVVVLHTDDEAVPARDDPLVGIGYAVILRNRAAGDYYPSLIEQGGPADRGSGFEFPGTAVVAGDTVVLTVQLAALGNPHVIRVALWTQRAEPGIRGSTTAWDFLPDRDTGVTQDWLMLRP